MHRQYRLNNQILPQIITTTYDSIIPGRISVFINFVYLKTQKIPLRVRFEYYAGKNNTKQLTRNIGSIPSVTQKLICIYQLGS